MELANFGPLLHTASTSTNNSAVTSLVEFLVPLKKIVHESVHTVSNPRQTNFSSALNRGRIFVTCFVALNRHSMSR